MSNIINNKQACQRLKRTTCGMLAGVATACAIVPFVASWMPSEKTVAAGEPIQVDLSALQPGQQMIVEWRGKPIWIIRRTDAMLKQLLAHEETLRDPDSHVDHQPSYAQNKYRSIKPEYLVLIGVCTHLGCSPQYKPSSNEFYCPCHGSIFDLAGRVLKNVPAPSNLEVPPYHFTDEHHIVIGQDA